MLRRSDLIGVYATMVSIHVLGSLCALKHSISLKLVVGGAGKYGNVQNTSKDGKRKFGNIVSLIAWKWVILNYCPDLDVYH